MTVSKLTHLEDSVKEDGESADGLTLTPSEIAEEIERGREFMREFPDTLHELAN